MGRRHTLAQREKRAFGVSPGVAAKRRGAPHPKETVDAVVLDGRKEGFIVMPEQEVCAGPQVVPELNEVLDNLAGLRTSVDVVAKEDEGLSAISRSFHDPRQRLENAVDIPDECDLVAHSVTRGSSS